MALMVFDAKWFISALCLLAFRDCPDHSIAGDVNVVEKRALAALTINTLLSNVNMPTMKRFTICQMDANTVLAFGMLLGLMLSMAIAVCPKLSMHLSSMSLPTSSACLRRRWRFDKDGSLLTTT